MGDNEAVTGAGSLESNALDERAKAIQNSFALLVRKVLDREELTPYALARRLRGIVAQRSVYDFLEGKDTRLKTLLAIFDACELEIGIGRRTPRRFDPRKVTKDEIIKELQRVEERKSVSEWVRDWERLYYYPKWLKAKWAEYEKQRIAQKGDDEPTAAAS